MMKNAVAMMNMMEMRMCSMCMVCCARFSKMLSDVSCA